MRILMLDNEFPPLGGGMGTANLALLKQFASLPDLEVDQITSALGGQREQVQFSESIRIFKVPVRNRNIHHSSNRELILYAIQALFLAIRLQRSRSYDFCFAWSTVPAGAVSLALYYLYRLPYMVWASGPDIPGFEQRYQYLYPLLKPLLRRVWRNAQPVIAKCQEEVDMIHAVENQLMVEVIPNGVDLTIFQPGPPIPEVGDLEVVCSARLIKRKGQRQLIEAARLLADEGIDVTVRFLGTGDSLEEYQQITKELGVADRIHFLGYVSREEIAWHYARAHVFVLPSYNEGMSLAALEAMSAGLPLVLTRTGGTDDLVNEGVNGFTFEWGDIDALVAHLRYLAKDRDMARRMGEASQERAKHFSWEMISRHYLAVFTGLTQKS